MKCTKAVKVLERKLIYIAVFLLFSLLSSFQPKVGTAEPVFEYDLVARVTFLVDLNYGFEVQVPQGPFQIASVVQIGQDNLIEQHQSGFSNLALGYQEGVANVIRQYQYEGSNVSIVVQMGSWNLAETYQFGNAWVTIVQNGDGNSIRVVQR